MKKKPFCSKRLFLLFGVALEKTVRLLQTIFRGNKLKESMFSETRTPRRVGLEIMDRFRQDRGLKLNKKRLLLLENDVVSVLSMTQMKAKVDSMLFLLHVFLSSMQI